MFGIKIIKKRDYTALKYVYETYQEYSEEKEAEISKLEHDCECLRQQLSDKMKELNKLHDENVNIRREVKSLREFRRDTLEAMGQIDLDGFRLSYCTKKCKHCENEQHDCRKYEFGKHQYCVIPK